MTSEDSVGGRVDVIAVETATETQNVSNFVEGGVDMGFNGSIVGGTGDIVKVVSE